MLLWCCFPVTIREQGPAAVAANDRVNLVADLRGRLHTGVTCEYNALSTLDDTYNNTTTTNVSSNITCWQYRVACLSFELDKANTPTDILFEVEVSLDGTNFTKLMNGPLGNWKYDDGVIGSGIERSLAFPIACQLIRVRVTAAGTDASNTFAVDNTMLYLRN